MANEFRSHYLTNKTIYAILIRTTDGKVWNGTTFESFNYANWPLYVITTTEQSTPGVGFYYGNMPNGISKGLYDVNYFLRLSTFPLSTDSLVGQQNIDWSAASVDIGINAALDSNNRVDIGAIVGSTTAAINQSKAALCALPGSITTATSLTTTTFIDSALTQSDDNFFVGRILIFLSGTLQYQATVITGFDHLTHKLTFQALTSAPTNGDTYIIL